MSINRVQKLLFSEYCDFEDMVLVESPFAQTTREGKGIRQVNLGLTPTKLVLATDALPSAKESVVTYLPGIDPETETFELVAVYPVECLNLSIFHRRKRQSLKAHFCNNKILYFELGGFEKRQMFWKLWCERVKFLSPEDPGSSHSETSVATSTSNSTLYLLAAKKIIANNGIPQLWYKFGSGENLTNPLPTWTDRYLYLGKKLTECPSDYKPIVNPPTKSQFVTTRKKLQRNIFSLPTTSNNNLLIKNISKNRSLCSCINRFGNGVNEGCNSTLFLPIENYLKNEFSETSVQPTDVITLYSAVDNQQVPTNYIDLVENSVKLWELTRDTNPKLQTRGRHRRRYGFAPQPHFLHGLGPWSVTPGERFSIQVKRAVSAVSIRRQPIEPELRLPVSRRQLLTSISYESLQLDKQINTNRTNLNTALRNPVIFFWTPDYWYRPRTAKDAYQELLNHLRKIRQYCQNKQKKSNRREGKRRLFTKNKKIQNSDTESESCVKRKRTIRKRNLMGNIFNSLKETYEEQTERESSQKFEEDSLQYLRRMLRTEIALTAWDFDSTTLAQQLTLIDRDLFLKIPSTELGILLWQQSSKNAPNIGALQAFSHRISCLVATEILRDDTEKIRARLIARLINTAEKCHELSNFQSCRSILCGLQSPAVYRLHLTWTYVRKRHATRYQIFENLCRLYRDPRLPSYQKAFTRASQDCPYIPSISDIIAKLFNRICLPKNVPPSDSSSTIKRSEENVTLRKILSTLKVISATKINSERKKSKRNNKNNTEFSFGDKKHVAYKLNSVIILLERSQRAAAAYAMRKNNLAWEYLLKARYREDRENFTNSLNVEKPCLIDNKYISNL